MSHCLKVLQKIDYLYIFSFNLGWYKGMPIPQDIYTLYVVEAGFYFHSIYATLFMDQWRRDSHLMIMHHILTNALIFFSFAVR